MYARGSRRASRAYASAQRAMLVTFSTSQEKRKRLAARHVPPSTQAARRDRDGVAASSPPRSFRQRGRAEKAVWEV